MTTRCQGNSTPQGGLKLGTRIICSLAAASALFTISFTNTNSNSIHDIGLKLDGHTSGYVSAAPVVRQVSPTVKHLLYNRQDNPMPPPDLPPKEEEEKEQEPVEEDPCATLGELLEPNITFEHVKRCYEHVPYNATLADDVLSTLYTLFRDYYIFIDSATLDNLEKPFTTPPVDMTKSLDLLSKRQFNSDFEFHKEVDLLVSSLNDAHANYMAQCYRHYLFIQPFELYAPVIDNVQTIRILQDKTFSNLEDCEVVTIDGKNAIDAIQDWADINSSISKDRGVRLNKALASYTFDTDKKDYILSTGSFSTRATLPEHEKVVYQIKCPTSPEFPEGQEHHMDVKWDIYRLITWNEFDSTESFLTQNCYKDTDPQNTENQHRRRKRGQTADEQSTAMMEPQQRDTEKKEKKEGKVKSHNIDLQESIQAAIEPLNHQTIHPIQRIHKRQQPLPSPAVRLVYNGTSTAFYQLLKRPEIGVVVIPTHSVNLKTETSIMEQGFGLLYNAGVQNVILDLTANGGGYVTFAYDLVDWMFPLDNITSVYQSDLRTPMSVKALSQVDLVNAEYNGYHDPAAYSDPVTRQDFTTNFFLQDRLIRRSRHRTSYSPLVLMNHNLGAFEMGMPWQHDAQRIVVMTDGSCGSACGMSLNRLKNTHGVKSYAVGGRQGEELSLFSFPGASVYGLDSLLDDFENLGVDPPMKRMRYKGIFRVPILEFYQEGESMPIEYNPKLFKADFHIDYTPITARYHEVLWEIVANNHWKQDGQTGDDPSIEQH